MISPNNKPTDQKQSFKISPPSSDMGTWQTLRRFSGYLLLNKGAFLLGLLAMIVYSFVTAAFPWALEQIIDGVDRDDVLPINRYLLISSLLLLMFMIRGIAYYWQNFIMLTLGQRLNRDLRDNLFRKLVNMPLKYFNKNNTGDLMSRFTNDINFIEQAFIIGVTGPIRDFSRVIFLLIYLWTLNIKLFFITFTLLLPTGYLISYFGQMNKKIADIRQKSLGNLNNQINEMLFGARIIKAFNMEIYEIRRFFKKNTLILKQFIETARIASFSTPLLEFIAAVYILIIFAYGSYLINTKELTNGSFFSFLVAFYMIIAPLRSFNGFFLKMQEAVASSKRIFDVLDHDLDTADEKEKPNLPVLQKKIKIKINSFAYHQKQILQNIDIEILKGETVALVGHSGSGKTTLVNLIPRFYELDSLQGKILFDENNIQDYSVTSLRDQIAIVTQETLLFNDTVRYNVVYGKQHQSDQQIIEACKRANAHQFITQFKDGYKQIVGEKGMLLSGGQRQRLAIARAILKNAPILILDEATNSLDLESESYVSEALQNLKKGRTTIVIAHKLSTVRNADKIFVMKNGQIVQQGTFNSLLAEAGEFKKLYDSV